MTENPYAASDVDNGFPIISIPRTLLSPGDAARRLFAIGLIGGVLLGSVGYLVLIGIVETLLVPPFKSPPNYGQFGIIVMGVAFYMSIFGMALSAVPYVKWIGYVPIHLIGVFLIWAADQQFFTEVDWREAPIVAMLMLLALPTAFAIVADFWYRNRALEL